jgi:hypothetical protein
MDLSTLTGHSEKIMKIIESIKSDPNLLNELKEHPQETLNKMGIELNEEELAIVHKLGTLNELKDEAISFLSKIKEFLGLNKAS